MSHTNVPVQTTDRPSRLFKELHATVRGAATTGRDPSLSGVFRRFAHSARGEGLSAERVVIALKRAYRAWMPTVGCLGRDEELPRLISLSIDSYYEDVDGCDEASRQPPLDAA